MHRIHCLHLSLAVLLAATSLMGGNAVAFERDVHFGLTKWLALQAGFAPPHAEAAAIGDQRVDSGDMQFMELGPLYSCFGKDAESAVEVARHHYPTRGKVPGPADTRTVTAGRDAAGAAMAELAKANENQAGYLLYRLGEALHAVQDSWSHQGVQEVPHLLDGAAACDADYTWAHPASRGGWNSHKADVTHAWPADTVAMAETTYELLQQYPAILGVKRSAKPWASLRPLVESFARAATKAQKAKWFADQGFTDVTFLEGVTLPDGPQPFTQQWKGDKLPVLKSAESDQHYVDPALLQFFNRFFVRFVSDDDLDAVAAEFAATPTAAPAGAKVALAPMDKSELAARLKAWRIRDHGRVAELAHALPPLSSQQRNSLAAIAKDRGALVHPASPGDAFMPLLIKTPEPTPLMGFIINKATPSPTGAERAVATTKFRHAPYDTVAVLAERTSGGWRVLSIAAMVDH